MAKAKAQVDPVFNKKSKSKGVFAKSKSSRLKTSKLYKKEYRGQGR